MQLSLKQKALLQTLTLMGSGMLTGLAVTLMFTYFSTQTIFAIFGAAILGYLCYIVYSINLSHLQYNEKLKEMTEKKA